MNRIKLTTKAGKSFTIYRYCIKEREEPFQGVRFFAMREDLPKLPNDDDVVFWGTDVVDVIDMENIEMEEI